MVKNLPANATDARDVGLILGSGRSPREGNGNSLRYSGLENSMERRVWQTTVHGVAKSQTRLSDFHFSVNLNLFYQFFFVQQFFSIS